MTRYSLKTRNTSPLNALFPKTRQQILQAALAKPSKWWYLSELARHLRTTPSSLQREIPSLIGAGIFEERRGDTRVYFRPERRSNVFRELRQLFTKAAFRGRKDVIPLRPAARRNPSEASRISPKLVTRYNREQLYREVWSGPIQRLAAIYGVSDVALAKTCRKLNIPLPGRGYWNKKSANKNVPERPPLPFLESN
jgi:hypothetical protein